MKTLLVHDAKGYVVSMITGDYHVPSGIPFLEIEIPEAKRIKMIDGIGIDVSFDPHQVILEDIPPSEVGVLRA
ncbi:hypothetical protein EJP77_04920 [Paenibacillus zeisoli]|uniref:Uncharacterized protein n=1 Tax=Paenibacillus zeisoli TaxID=2496267 RepID=A0A433XQH2_9BACL|nr:hypothetical protein [Paenibacillus zeisoli]RUT36330.1 hypothetical protein EJP77_04920 [Paenibacillus zeisoli]